MKKNIDRDAEVLIIFKDKNKDGGHEDLTIRDIDVKTAKKIYKKLIHQWNTKKAIQIPTHAITVASDAIFYNYDKKLRRKKITVYIVYFYNANDHLWDIGGVYFDEKKAWKEANQRMKTADVTDAYVFDTEVQ